MADSRKKLCGHIRAARDWLGRAESSLEMENDIKGDLNLMLAEAELQRARETDRKSRRVKILAPAMALLLALGGLALYSGGEEQLFVETKPAHEAEAPAGGQLAVPDALPAAALAGELPAEAAAKSDTLIVQERRDEGRHGDAAYAGPGAAPVLQETAAPRSSEAPQLEEEEPPRPVEQRTTMEVSPPRETPQASVPAPDRQKLMLSAGRALRE